MKNTTEKILELSTIEQWKTAFPIMKQHRTDFEEGILKHIKR